MRLTRLLAALLLTACTHSAANLPARNPADDTACALDGMLLRDFAGAKAQIRYADGKTDYYCDVMELLGEMLAPEQHRNASAFYVQDMGKADWNRPVGNWIAARDAVYVAGSKAQGSMGPTMVPFARQQDAEAFIRTNGGRVLRFSDLDLSLLNRADPAMPAHGMH